MKKEEAVEQLKKQWGEAVLSESEFLGEITLEVQKDKITDLLQFLKKPEGAGFEVLMDLTAVDYLLPEKRTKVVYLLHNPTNYERLRLVLFAKRGESVPSATFLWEGVNWYEREVYDLFGVKFEGHPDLKRILLPDDWSGHPLRRDYALTEESVEFKHDVKPKVPSEIIPYVQNSSKL